MGGNIKPSRYEAKGSIDKSVTKILENEASAIIRDASARQKNIRKKIVKAQIRREQGSRRRTRFDPNTGEVFD